MFSTLKQGDSIYIIELDKHITWKQGVVISNNPSYTGGVDIKVKVNDSDYEFKQLPFNLTFTTYGNTIVTDSKESMLSEISKLKTNSDLILSKLDYYIQVSKDCDGILRLIDPSYDKEQRRDEELKTLKDLMDVMAQSIANIEKLLNK